MQLNLLHTLNNDYISAIILYIDTEEVPMGAISI